MIRETRMHVYTSRWLVQQTLCHGRNVGGYVGLYVCLYIYIYIWSSSARAADPHSSTDQ